MYTSGPNVIPSFLIRKEEVRRVREGDEPIEADAE